MLIKSFKDPVYGYVGIPADLVRGVVDTQAFQRLRHIKFLLAKELVRAIKNFIAEKRDTIDQVFYSRQRT